LKILNLSFTARHWGFLPWMTKSIFQHLPSVCLCLHHTTAKIQVISQAEKEIAVFIPAQTAKLQRRDHWGAH
jgi:hypothetical protein